MTRKGSEMKQTNNTRGFSYIELMITIAILVALLALVGSSINRIYALDAKKCANELDNLIAHCKIGAMTRAGDVYLKVYVGDAGVVAEYYENDVLMTSEKMGKKTIDLSYIDSNGTEHSGISMTSPLVLSFERETGQLMDIADSADLAGMTGAVTTADVFCQSVRIMSAGNIYRIELIPSTGKHDVTV